MIRFLLLFLFAVSFALANDRLSKIDHIIVVYLENRSFDNLFRSFEGADTSDKPVKPFGLQRDLQGSIYADLPMGEEGRRSGLPEKLPNVPFLIDTYLSQEKMMPDLVHRFYQNQLQIDGGSNEQFVAVSDQLALTMGYHDMRQSALWKYAREYTLCDRFFAAAFGGSFLNHQWLIAARTPYVGENDSIPRYELSPDGKIIRDGILTPDGYAVNTIQPFYPPYKAKYADPNQRLAPLEYDTIGDRLSGKQISWNWYSGGYDEAVKGNGKAVNYQYHHNPFVYFKRYAPGTEGRSHIKDEKAFFSDLEKDDFPQVAFFKPSADDNQHPGYASVKSGDDKVRQIVEAVKMYPKIWDKAIIIVTYDENGGLWDHVAPFKADRWGPGTRIPAIIISPYAKRGYIDHTEYDTTSILKLIETRYGLEPLGERDKNSNNLENALDFRERD